MGRTAQLSNCIFSLNFVLSIWEESATVNFDPFGRMLGPPVANKTKLHRKLMEMLSLTFFMALFVLALGCARVKDTSPKMILKMSQIKKNK